MTISSFQQEVPQSLIDRAKAGELDAFERLYRMFERPAYTLALRILGDAEAARDVLHDAAASLTPGGAKNARPRVRAATT